MSDSAIRFVVTPVHGTYTKGAPWTQDKSKLEQALTQRFGASVLWRPCEWSGHNNPAARAEGRDLLRAHLSDLLGTYKDASHYIIAHSHGGNVALYALQDKVLRDSIAGVACLATPFLVSRPRVLGSQSVTVHLAGAVGLLFLVVGFLATWWLPAFEPDWLRTLMVVAFASLVMALVGVLEEIWSRFAKRLDQELQLVTVSQERPAGVYRSDGSRLASLIIRAPGDEASAALLFFQFVSELSVRLYVLLYQLQERFLGLLNRWKEHRLRLLAALIVGFVLNMVVIIGAAALKMPMGATLILVLLAAWLGIAVPVLTLIGRIDTATVPVQALMGAVLFTIIIVLSITLLPFGWQVALSNILLDITAETTPPGKWVVDLIEPSRSQDQTGNVPALEHSIVYEDECALTLTCYWIERTEKRSHADG